MNTTRREKSLKELVLHKCWKYINANFHSFNQANKIKVALALLQKSMPTEVEGVNFKNVVVMNDVVKDGAPVRYNFAQASAAGDLEDSGQVRPALNEA